MPWGRFCTAGLKPVLRAGELNQLLLTFGLSVLIQNLALIFFGGNVKTIFVPYKTMTISLGGLSFGAGRLLTFLLAVVLLLALYLVLQRTRFGRAIRAVSRDPEGAALIGIAPEKINLYAFGLATGFAAVGRRRSACTSGWRAWSCRFSAGSTVRRGRCWAR